MPGKLFVIEGCDASGKATQAKRLVERLESGGHKTGLISFPRYEEAFGKLVRKYLDGGFGPIASLPIEMPSLLYALDRFDFKPELEKMLGGGKIVVADRYTASNIAHQAVKLEGGERQKFVEWIECVESRMPSPTATVFLDVPVAFSQKLMEAQGRAKDLHEADIAYLEKVRQLYLELAKQQEWKVIACVKEGRLLSIDEIHELVWESVSAYI